MNLTRCHIALQRTVLCATALALVACASTPPPSGRLPLGSTSGDQTLSPFYRWNGPLPKRPGALLREEGQPGQPEIDAAGKASRILYTSVDVRWQSGMLPVSGTLYLPRGAPPAGGWPLLAWAHGTLGVADVCAPSWALHKPRDATYINRWLKAGFAVVATDYQGLGGPGPHPYLIWQAEGRSVLDSARAALVAHPESIANRVIVSGQSQGSGAAIGAARLAASYAPELDVRGAVATGVVSSFPDGPYQPPSTAAPGGGAPHYAIMSMVGGGLRDEAPGVDQLVSPAGQPLLAEARRACSPEVSALARQLKVGMAAAFAVPLSELVKYRLPVTDMTMERISVPLLLGTGLADRTIPPQRQYNAVAALCASGNAVTWQRYPGIGHNGGVNAAFDDALAFARLRLSGAAVTGNCSQASVPDAPGSLTPGIPFND